VQHLLVHADLVFTGEDREIVDGAVLVGDHGTVLDVGAASDLRARHAGARLERVRGAVMPGLVNAHTHLELSSLHGKIAGGRGFVAWVDALVGTRAESAMEDDVAAIDEAVEAMRSAGTVAVGDVTNTLAAVAPLARRGFAGSVFHEVFGIEREAVLRRASGLRQERDERVPRWPSADLTYAPAPHTLYTTHPDAVSALVAAARRAGTPTSLHLAEHAAERLAMERGEGPVVAWLAQRTKQERVWPKRPLFDVARDLGVLAPGTLLVHLTDARPDEVLRVAESGASVVLCPRSNAHIEGRTPPLEAMLAAGISPALGTDSLASSPSLDVLGEAAALAAAFPGVAAWRLVAMATANGARALARVDLGRLVPGARPGVLAIELESPSTGAGAARGPLPDRAALDLDPRALLLDAAHGRLARRFVVPRPAKETLPS
jgi:cytosine/adenosine deaminase-related metal-dependent hydrolase